MCVFIPEGRLVSVIESYYFLHMACQGPFYDLELIHKDA